MLYSASRWETFGISLIEAMNFQLPILTTIHEGNSEWIYNYPVDIFEIDNMNDFINKIKLIYKSKPKKKTMICQDLIIIIYATK